MNHARCDITKVIQAHLISSDTTTMDTCVELGYRSSDPFAVHAEFTGYGFTSNWVLARDLFGQGLMATQDSPAGEGDVLIWRDEDPAYVLMSLTGSLGTALLAAPAEPIEQFIDATRALVPVGAESVQVDAAVEAFVMSILTS